MSSMQASVDRSVPLLHAIHSESIPLPHDHKTSDHSPVSSVQKWIRKVHGSLHQALKILKCIVLLKYVLIYFYD